MFEFIKENKGLFGIMAGIVALAGTVLYAQISRDQTRTPLEYFSNFDVNKDGVNEILEVEKDGNGMIQTYNGVKFSLYEERNDGKIYLTFKKAEEMQKLDPTKDYKQLENTILETEKQKNK